MKKSIIVTCYNNEIDSKLPIYQKMVIDKFRGTIPFLSLKFPYSYQELNHGDLLNKCLHDSFYDMGADCILFIDVDCVPLNKECVEAVFDLAYSNKLVGNIQRSNHLENNEHTYVGAPFICFSKSLYESVGCPTMRHTHHGDTCEQLTYNCEKEGIEVIKFMPSHSECAYDENGSYWDLEKGMPKYGIGTIYSYNGMEMNYHLFCSRENKFNKLFFNKCHELIVEK
jgi:predicted glycosyltransferase involved in capsule biosynthesis